MTSSYRLKIKFGEIEIEVESTDEDFVNQNFDNLRREYVALLESDSRDSGVKSTKGPDSANAKSVNKSMSLAEFVRLIKPRSGTDYAVTLGYYIEKITGKEEFTGGDIRSKFIEVKYKHSNPSDTISKAKATGRIMDGHEKNSYILTQTGEQWVEERLER